MLTEATYNTFERIWSVFWPRFAHSLLLLLLWERDNYNQNTCRKVFFPLRNLLRFWMTDGNNFLSFLSSDVIFELLNELLGWFGACCKESCNTSHVKWPSVFLVIPVYCSYFCKGLPKQFPSLWDVWEYGGIGKWWPAPCQTQPHDDRPFFLIPCFCQHHLYSVFLFFFTFCAPLQYLHLLVGKCKYCTPPSS